MRRWCLVEDMVGVLGFDSKRELTACMHALDLCDDLGGPGFDAICQEYVKMTGMDAPSVNWFDYPSIEGYEGFTPFYLTWMWDIVKVESYLRSKGALPRADEQGHG